MAELKEEDETKGQYTLHPVNLWTFHEEMIT